MINKSRVGVGEVLSAVCVMDFTIRVELLELIHELLLLLVRIVLMLLKLVSAEGRAVSAECRWKTFASQRSFS